MNNNTQKHPPEIPLLEWLSSQWKLAGNALNTLMGYKKRLGNVFKIHIGFKSFYVIAEPEIIKYILQTNNKNYKKAKATQILGEVIGQGLLTAEGDYWLRQRRLIQPAFHKAKLAELVKIISRETDIWLNDLAQRIEQNDTLNIARETMNITLNVVTKSLFSSGIQYEELNKIDKAIKSLSEYVAIRVRKPFQYNILKWAGRLKYYDNQSKLLDEIVYGIINERKKNQESYSDLLALMLDTVDEETGEKAFSDQQLRDETMILFLAGHETSANALAWAFYLIAQHPEVEAKLLAEFEEVLGENEPDFTNLGKLSYAGQVIHEVLRMYPPAWIMSRESLQEDNIGDLKIPKGVYLYLFIYGVHHDSKYWTNPEEFEPERFTAENEKKQSPFTYFPFGGGPRLCIGNNFAILEMKIILAQLLKKYKLQLIEEKPVDFEPLITLRPKNGIRLKFIKR